MAKSSKLAASDMKHHHSKPTHPIIDPDVETNEPQRQPSISEDLLESSSSASGGTDQVVSGSGRVASRNKQKHHPHATVPVNWPLSEVYSRGGVAPVSLQQPRNKHRETSLSPSQQIADSRVLQRRQPHSKHPVTHNDRQPLTVRAKQRPIIEPELVSADSLSDSDDFDAAPFESDSAGRSSSASEPDGDEDANSQLDVSTGSDTENDKMHGSVSTSDEDSQEESDAEGHGSESNVSSEDDQYDNNDDSVLEEPQSSRKRRATQMAYGAEPSSGKQLQRVVRKSYANVAVYLRIPSTSSKEVRRSLIRQIRNDYAGATVLLDDSPSKTPFDERNALGDLWYQIEDRRIDRLLIPRMSHICRSKEAFQLFEWMCNVRDVDIRMQPALELAIKSARRLAK